MISYYLSAAVIRAAQGLVVAGPTLLVGLLVAAILRYYVGRDGIQRLLGGDSRGLLFRSWLLGIGIGLLLPVRSIGVLPILYELYRAKVRPGTLSAFAITAPLFNPLSLLYGLTLSRPIVVLAFVMASLLVATGLGVAWDRWSGRQSQDLPTTDATDSQLGATKERDAEAGAEIEIVGLYRLLAVLVYACRQMTGSTAVLALIAVGGLGVLGVVLPFTALQTSFEMNDPFAPEKMTLLALPVYASPMAAMGQLGMMFVHHNSIGAALASLLIGCGMNLGTLAWLGKHYGVRSCLRWLVALLLIVLAISYAVDKPLVMPGAEPAGHTHAFDIYANPFPGGTQVGVSIAWQTFRNSVGLTDALAWGALGVMVLMGVVLRWCAIDERWVAGLRRERGEADGWERPVPAWAVAFTVVGGLAATSVVACMAYYPPAEEVLEEIRIVRAEALTAATSGNREAALHWLGQWEDWTRRLEVGVYMRSGGLRPYQRVQGELLRKNMERLEHVVEEEPLDREELQQLIRQIYAGDRRWRAAFRPVVIAAGSAFHHHADHHVAQAWQQPQHPIGRFRHR